MSASAAFTQSWPVGRYTATLTSPMPKPGHTLSACIDWSPSTPGHLTEAELAEYRAGRNAAFAALSQQLGIRAALIEV